MGTRDAMVEGVLRARPELAAPEFWPPPSVPQLAVKITPIAVRTKNHRLVICANSLDSVTVQYLNRYQPPKSQQRAEEPLLSEFAVSSGSPHFASSRLHECPRFGYANGNALAIHRPRH